MRTLHLMLVVFLQVLLASFVFYTNLSSALPVEQQQPAQKQKQSEQMGAPVVQPADKKEHEQKLQARALPEATKTAPTNERRAEKTAPDSPVVVNRSKTSAGAVKGHSQQRKEEMKQPSQQKEEVKQQQEVKQSAQKQEQQKEAKQAPARQQEEKQQKAVESVKQAPHYFDAERPAEPEAPKAAKLSLEAGDDDKKLEPKQMINQPYNPNGGYGGQTIVPTGQQVVVAPNQGGLVPGQQVTVISTGVVAPNGGFQPYQPPYRPYKSEEEAAKVAASAAPVVKGGLGPLHLLAATLCSYQADKPVTDETLSQLYSHRAALRKALFDFMSLKFTSLERFSSRLNSGGVALEVVPPKIAEDPSQSSPTHGWPVVGRCTAHDLHLMAEAAWCEASDNEKAEEQPPAKITSNRHTALSRAARQAPSEEADKSAIISKLLHVSDVKEAPVVEGAIALDLAQVSPQQQAPVAQANSTRECRRNALRMARALLEHLAEDQRIESSSWPKLYAEMVSDECARKRMIDIVSTLSGYRTEASSIRRDNMEFAFAMDDLRTKVLESEVNVPLTFDKQFIEVGQFMQQSVKLMLSNIDPDRAKLTSMRYRSLMPGPVSTDDQCIELHQRLLAKNYPTDCNPNQFGQLPDVLRMAASSLELWSIESDLAKQTAKTNPQLYPQSAHEAASAKQEANQCIANLVNY